MCCIDFNISVLNSASPPTLMFNSGMFSPSSMGSLTPPISTASSVDTSPAPTADDPPSFSTPMSSKPYSSYMPSPVFSNPNMYSPPMSHPAQQKFDGPMQKFDPMYFNPQSIKFEAKYEPNLSVESSPQSQQNKNFLTSDILVQNNHYSSILKN